MTPYGIHWFRRDLRIAGNPALRWNYKESKGRTLGVFFFDSKFLARPDFSHHRFAFFLKTLQKLKEEMQEMGGDLLVLNHSPDEGFDRLLTTLQPHRPQWITFNRDYEPFARDRDTRITQHLRQHGVTVHTERDHLVIEPQELRKDDSPQSFYQVYTPFSKKWFALSQKEDFLERIHCQKEALSYLEKRSQGAKITPFFHLKWDQILPSESRSHWQDALEDFTRENDRFVKISIPEAGSLAAYQTVKQFAPSLKFYLEKRDFPDLAGTSKLSLYFKNGSITLPMVIQMLNLHQVQWGKPSGEVQFLKELIWREFYYHILFHRPQVETEAFLAHYRHLAWENREDWFEAWKQGRTGYPIVDAGMRQLATTGWMHNRVRMIVASFLTKDLLIDWRWGENHFMKELLDGDLAPNNGGWQWAASTGCDPQPYFRIFNPILQSQKFDPDGKYLRKYVPELRTVSTSEIHFPSRGYLKPIVDHATQKEKALALYKRG